MGRLVSLSAYGAVLLLAAASLYLVGATYAALTSAIIGRILRTAASRAPIRPPEEPVQHASARRVATGCEPLTRELAAGAAAANSLGVVFATFTNQAQADFALNWIVHLERLGLEQSALVGATDAGAEHLLVGARRRCFSLSSGIGSDEAKWGSAGFTQMGRTKADLVARFLSFNITLFFADADVVFLQECVTTTCCLV